jgi:hypothetical protein
VSYRFDPDVAAKLFTAARRGSGWTRWVAVIFVIMVAAALVLGLVAS